MFKITTIDNQAQSVLLLEGSLVGPWLPELQRTWDETRQTHEGAMLIVDLTNLTIVSQHGENILFQMMSEGARIVGKSFLAREVLKQLERRRNRQREERNGRSGKASVAVGIVVLLALTAQFSWASTQGQPHPASEGLAIEALSAGIPELVPMSTSRTQEGEGGGGSTIFIAAAFRFIGQLPKAYTIANSNDSSPGWSRTAAH